MCFRRRYEYLKKSIAFQENDIFIRTPYKKSNASEVT